MTYLISTCRKSTAVLGSVYGNFDGTGEYHHLVLNCVNRLEVWEISVADLDRLSLETPNNNHNPFSFHGSGFGFGGGVGSGSGGGAGGSCSSPPSASISNLPPASAFANGNFNGTIDGFSPRELTPPPMRLVAEYPMNATIKHMLAVPLPVARTTRHPRLCIFVTTEKLDVCIIALNRNKIASSSTPSSPVDRNEQYTPTTAAAATQSTATCGKDEETEIVPETLYSTNISSSLFHRHFGQASLCVSSHTDTSFGAPSAAALSSSSHQANHHHHHHGLNNTNNNANNNDAVNTNSSTPASASSSSSSSGSTANVFGEEDIAPIVALSHIRSYIILFDIAACIVDGAAATCVTSTKLSSSRAAGAKISSSQQYMLAKKRTRGKQNNTAPSSDPKITIATHKSNGVNDDEEENDECVDVISQSTVATNAAPLSHSNKIDNNNNAHTASSTESTILDNNDERSERQSKSREGNDATEPAAAVGSSSSGKEQGETFLESDEPSDLEVSQQLSSTRLFSMAFISNSLIKKRTCLPFSFCPISEPEPRSICLQRSPTFGKALVVLSQDPLGRTHVRRYTITEQILPDSGSTSAATASGGAEGNGNGVAFVRAGGAGSGGNVSSSVDILGGTVGHTMLQFRQMPILAPVFDRSVLRLVPKATGLALTRGTMLQNDVETDAMLLFSMPRGVLVIGSVLATYIDTESRGLAKGHVTTVLTPSPFGRSEPVAVQSLSPISCVVGYINGALIVCALDDGERGELSCYTLAPETTPMTGLSTIGGGFFFASSAYSNSVFIHKNSGYTVPAIANAGPIVEMNVLDSNNPSLAAGTTSALKASAANPSNGGMAVIAATGVEHFTSLQVIREAIQLNEEAVIDGLPGVLALHSIPAIAPPPGSDANLAVTSNNTNPSSALHTHASASTLGLMAISFANETRMMLFEDGQTLSLEEADFTCDEPTLCLGRLAPSAAVHVTPAGACLLHIMGSNVRQSGPTAVFPRRANIATTDPQCSTLLVVSGSEVSIYELPSLQCLHTINFPRQIASIDMTAAYEVVVGLWDKNDIQMFTADDLTPFTLAEGLPMLPRSVRLSSLIRSRFMADASATADRSSMTGRHLFIGFPDGSIGLIPVSSAPTPMATTTDTPSSSSAPACYATGPLEHLALGSQPVSVIPILNTNRIPSGILCTGDVPGALFASSNSKAIESSGFGVRHCDHAAQLTATTFATYLSNEAKLVISSLDAKIAHKINALGTPIRQTIPKMKLVPQWNNLLLAAVREPLHDLITPFYVSSGVVNKSTRVAAPLALLESERCEFIEFIELNGAPFTVAEGEVPLSQYTSTNSANPFNNNNNSSNDGNANPTSNSAYFTKGGFANWDPAAPFSAALIGTNFAYPSDDIPRNGRIMLVGMERGAAGSSGAVQPAAGSNKMSFVQLCDRDIRGMVMCACMVPRTNNRILVGVTGCVQMYRWSPTDKSFVFEISASFGAAIMRLIPLAGSSLGAMKVRPQPPQIVAATPAVRAAPSGSRRPGSNTSQRTLGGFSSVNITNLGAGGRATNAASPLSIGDSAGNDDSSPMALDDRETSSLVLCADMRNSLAVIALNPVELMRIEANERVFREVLDVIPAGNKSFIEPKTGLRVYDPHFITSDTDLNLFIISAMKEKKPATEGGSVYQLKGVVPQLAVCGQIHVGDRVTVLQRGSLQVTKKLKSTPVHGKKGAAVVKAPATLRGFKSNDQPRSALDIASAAAAAAGNTLSGIATPVPQQDQQQQINPRALSPLGGGARRNVGGWGGSFLPDVTARYADPSVSSGTSNSLVVQGVRDVSLPSFIFGTVHGALGAIVPLNPLAFNYLGILQRCLVKCIRPVGNLSYDQFKKVFNRETSAAMTSTPHFIEARDGDDSGGRRTAKLKAYNFIDGDLLYQFLAPCTSATSTYGMDTNLKTMAVHMTNKAIRAAAFSGELFRGTNIDSKRLGLGGAASPTTVVTNALLGPSGPNALNANSAAVAAAAAAQNTPTVLGGPSFTAAQTQPPASIPATPMSILPARGNRGGGVVSQQDQQQQQLSIPISAAAPPQQVLTDANGVAFDANGNRIDPAAANAAPKRTTFTPSEIEHLNELLSIAELPEYPLTVDSCERFLSDLQRFC